MTAEKARPFISLMRHVCMHVRLIMQQLFINRPPFSQWLGKRERFWPQMCASVCLPFDVQRWFSISFKRTVLVSELGPRQPLLQRGAV